MLFNINSQFPIQQDSKMALQLHKDWTSYQTNIWIFFSDRPLSYLWCPMMKTNSYQFFINNVWFVLELELALVTRIVMKFAPVWGLFQWTETQKQNIAGNLTSSFSASSSAASSAASGSGCNVWQCDIDENITWRVALSSGANRISVIPSPSSASSSSSDVSEKWQNWLVSASC